MTMRISTNQIFQNGLNNILRQEARVAQLNEQLSDGFVKVQTSADDPIAFAQIQLMNQRISMTEFLQKNRQNADSALSMEEDILNDCTSTLMRIRDLQVKAGNPALSEENRKSLAASAMELLNELLSFANAKDIYGDYMFSGSQTATQPFSMDASGNYVYNGDSTQRFQLVMSDLQVAINNPGDTVFMRIPTGNGVFSVGQTATPNTGTASVSTGSVVNSSAYVPDNYTMSFALNSQGNLVVMVSGVSSGYVIPPSGLPDDAPLYQEDMDVSFNGIEVSVSGTPQPGDTFSIIPAQNTSVFAIIQNMINNLNQPYSTATDKAAATTVNNQILAELDSALSTILDTRASLGSRLKQLEQADISNTNLIELSTIVLGSIQATNPIQVASEYEQEQIYLQVALKSFVQIQSMSMFNYL